MDKGLKDIVLSGLLSVGLFAGCVIGIGIHNADQAAASIFMVAVIFVLGVKVGINKEKGGS